VIQARTKVTPEAYTETLAEREANYTKFDYTPTQPLTDLLPGTYYLEQVDALERRQYSRAYHTTTGARAAVPARAQQQQQRPHRLAPVAALPSQRVCSLLRGFRSTARFMRR